MKRAYLEFTFTCGPGCRSRKLRGGGDGFRSIAISGFEIDDSLESRLGVRLLTRTTRRLALTAEGEVFLNRSREILYAIEAAESEIVSGRRAAQGHLRVHAFPTFAIDHLSAALPKIEVALTKHFT